MQTKRVKRMDLEDKLTAKIFWLFIKKTNVEREKIIQHMVSMLPTEAIEKILEEIPND